MPTYQVETKDGKLYEIETKRPVSDPKVLSRYLEQHTQRPSQKRSVGDVAFPIVKEIATSIGAGVGGVIGAGTGLFGTAGVGTLPLAMGGAALGGGIARQGVELLRPLMTDEPRPPLKEQAVDLGTSMLFDGLTEGLFTGTQRLVRYGTEQAFRGTPGQFLATGERGFQLRPREVSTMNILEEGSELLGRTGTGREGVLSRSQIGLMRGREGPSAIFEQFAFNSLGGRQLVANPAKRNAQEAVQAAFTQAFRDLNTQGNYREASDLLVRAVKDSESVVTAARRGFYAKADKLAGNQARINTQPLLDEITSRLDRRDVDMLMSQVERRIPGAQGRTVEDLLTTTGGPQIGQTIDVNLPGVRKVTVLGPGSQPGTVSVQIGTGGRTELPVDLLPQASEPVATLGRVEELRQIFGTVERNAARSNNPELQAAGRTARFLKSRLDKLIALQEKVLPKDALRAYRLARKVAAEEAQTFRNPLIQKVTRQLALQPDKFASVLIQPQNADVLDAVRKAMQSVPALTAEEAFRSPQALTGALRRQTTLRTGKQLYNQRIRPALQAAVIEDAAFTGSQRGAPAALTTREPIAEFVRRGELLELRPTQLVEKLRDLTPGQRKAIFATDEAYEKWLRIGEAMQDVQLDEPGAASFLAIIKQSGALTSMLTQFSAAFGAGMTGAAMAGAAGGIGFGGAVFVAPIVLAKWMANPERTRRLWLGLRKPSSHLFKRVALQLMQESLIAIAQSDEPLSQPLRLPPANPQMGGPVPQVTGRPLQ